MRKLVTCRRISEIRPIAGADRIELAIVDGWQCVVGKGAFRPGDLGIYFEIDAILPELDALPHLRNSNWRVRTQQFRGELSQGLLLSLAEVTTHFGVSGDDLAPLEPNGQDYSELLGVTKYEKPLPLHGEAAVIGGFPEHLVPKTDQERVQNLTDLWDRYADEVFYVEEKLNGTSCTVFASHETQEYGICGRELRYDPAGDVWYAKAAVQLLDRLRSYPHSLAVQGELLGPQVQENRYRLNGYRLFVFDIYDIVAKRYLSQPERLGVLSELDEPSVTTVPVLPAVRLAEYDLQGLLRLAAGPSDLYPQTEREGLVLKSLRPLRAQSPLTFKVISNRFLLKHKDE